MMFGAVTPLDIVPNIIAAAVFIGALIFIIVYASFSNWTKTGPGRALMYWAISFDALILMNTIHLATGRYPGIEFVRMVVYSALLWSVIRLVTSLVAILREGDRTKATPFFDRTHKE